MKTFLQSLRLLAALTVLTGLLYPLAVWACGRAFFPHTAEGSLLLRDGRPAGSALLAQKNADARYFQPRPSAGDHATVASGAGNQAWTSAKLAASRAERRAAWGGGAEVPADLLTASGSGLDPHLSLAAVRAQIARVAESRQLSAAQRVELDSLITRLTEGGTLSPTRINVLQLNLALDATFSR